MARVPQAPAKVPGKPVIARYATPNLNDRIYVLRKDTRLANYQLPDKGAAYDGPNARKFTGFKFATSVPSAENPEWEDWYYLNERANQDQYNYAIEYPGGDKDIARITRTYVFLREGYQEISNTAADPIYAGTVLVDRKILRIEDPIVDALFIMVQRVFEELPGVELTTTKLGEPDLIPPKYRRLVKDIQTEQPVSANYVFPVGLTGDEAEIELIQESITRARLRVLEQIITINDEMLGGKTDNWGDLVIHESIVNEGDAIDEGFLVKDSSVTPLGNGKAIKITVNYPAGLAGVALLEKTLGQDNLIPAKYRGLVKHVVTNTMKDPDTYVFPTSLTGDQAQIEYIQDTIHQARLKIIEEIIETEDSLIGHEQDKWGFLTITESIVDDGTAADDDYLVLKSSVTPLGNGKSIKITVEYPANLAAQVLLSKTLGQDNLIPAKYRGLVRHDITDKLVDADSYTFPSVLTGDQSQIEYIEETLHRARLKIIEEVIEEGSELVGKEQDKWGFLTITESIVNDGTAADDDYLVLKSSVTPLGNGKSVKITVEYPANLASQVLLSKTLGQDNLIPEKYRGLVRHDITDKLVDADSYSFPSVLTGDQTQIEYIEETLHRARLKIIEEVIDAGGSLVGHETDPWAVLVITESIVNDGTQVDSDFFTVKSTVTPLGNGKSVKITVAYPANLAAQQMIKKTLGQDSTIPDKYRNLVTRTETEKKVDIDTYTFPTDLTGNQIKVEYAEEAIHRARQTIITEVINSGDPLAGEDLDKWGTLTIEESVVNEGAAIDTGFLVLKSTVTPIGGGKAIKITVNYPADLGSFYHRGQDYEAALDVVVPYREQMRVAGSGIGNAQTQVEPQSRDRELQRVPDLTTLNTVLGNYILTFPGTTNLQLPDVLDSIDSFVESRSGEGFFSEEGSAGWSGSGSASLDIKGSGNSSASIMPVVVAQISQPWGHNVDTTRLMFFLPMPVTKAQILAKLNSLLTPRTVSPWPKFRPVGATIFCIGEALTLSCEASAKWMSGGSDSGSQFAVSQGTGASRRFELTINSIRIPPTIHRAIAGVGGDVIVEEQVSIECTADAVAAVGVAEGHISEEGTVTGRAYGSIAATSPDALPTEGLHLLDTRVEPYKYGWAMCHCEVVDFADVTEGGDPTPIILPPPQGTTEIWGRIKFHAEPTDTHSRVFTLDDGTNFLYLRPPKPNEGAGVPSYWYFGFGTDISNSRVLRQVLAANTIYTIDFMFRYDPVMEHTIYVCSVNGIGIEGVVDGSGYHGGYGSLIMNGSFAPDRFRVGSMTSEVSGTRSNNRTIRYSRLGVVKNGLTIFDGTISGGVIVPPFDSVTAGVTGSGSQIIISSASGVTSQAEVGVIMP